MAQAAGRRVIVVFLIVTLVTHAGNGLREVKFPMASMMACEYVRTHSLNEIVGHYGQIERAECVVVERGA
jgi:hypothetical protein